MKVAITHDWLVGLTGAERVLEQLLLCYPGADVFTTVNQLTIGQQRVLRGARVVTSFLQRMPFVRGHHWEYIPLMPFAMEQFDLSSYDLVISNSHAVARGVMTGPEQVHVSYVLSPMRFAWDLQPLYLRDFRMEHGLRSVAARLLFHRLRQWDATTAHRADHMIAISSYIRRRIEVCYRREAAVVFPPVDLDFYTPGEGPREDFYVAVSRLTPFKRVDLVVDAFARLPGRRLVVIGDGPEYHRIRDNAPPNVVLLGYQPDEVVRDHMRRARAYLFAAPEDFGIVMVEAQACGAPVIALGRGGALEIVRGLDDASPTGVFFPEQTPGSVAAAVHAFEQSGERIQSAACRANAERFATDRFRAEITEQISAAVARFGVRR